MKFISLHQLQLDKRLAHILALLAGGTLMSKHFAEMSALLYVYDIVHSVGCNK
jgi:hypothetical protein